MAYSDENQAEKLWKVQETSKCHIKGSEIKFYSFISSGNKGNEGKPTIASNSQEIPDF